MQRRPVQERIDEQLLLIDKAQKRNDEIALSHAKRIERIAERAGVYETDDPAALIEKAIKQVVSAAKEKEKNKKSAEKNSPINAKAQREKRVYRQNMARIERATRTIRRLKNEARRTDASQKWRLGFLLQLANRESMSLDSLDEKLGAIVAQLVHQGTQEQWQKIGSELLKKQKEAEQKSASGNNAYRVSESDKADSHRKITLGGLVKKHKLDALSPALLLGALLDMDQNKI